MDAGQTDSTPGNEPTRISFPEMLSDGDLPEVLFHYTDISGLRGIWEKGELWATSSLFMNDTSELQLGPLVIERLIAERQAELMSQLVDVTEREIEARRAGREVDGSLFDREREQFAPELAELRDVRSAIDYAKDMTAVITCLTEQGDQLSQWRGYAREGYCIGLKTSALLNHLDSNDFVTRRVRYYGGETEQDHATRSIDIAKAFRAAMLTIDELREDEDARKFAIGKFVMLDASFLKDNSFSEEREVRIVSLNARPNLFTPHRYGMVPRLTLSIPREAIVSVRVGPSAHTELKKESLKTYFLNVGFGGTPLAPIGERERPIVIGSKIPFRDW